MEEDDTRDLGAALTPCSSIASFALTTNGY